MADQPGKAPLTAPVSVIGDQFIEPNQIDIIVDIISSGNLVITDTDHKMMLKVKGCNSPFHRQRVLLDVDDKPVVTIRQKIKTGHDRWNVFRGDSKSQSDLIFSTKKPRMIQFETNVHVFLENKISQKDVCDFRFEGSWSKRKCTIYLEDTSTTIAQIYKMDSSENLKFVKDKFMVTIHPNVDYAFVVTLITIVEAMKSSDANDAPPGPKLISGVAMGVSKLCVL